MFQGQKNSKMVTMTTTIRRKGRIMMRRMTDIDQDDPDDVPGPDEQ